MTTAPMAPLLFLDLTFHKPIDIPAIAYLPDFVPACLRSIGIRRHKFSFL